MLKACNNRKPRKVCSLLFFPVKLKCSLFGALKCVHKWHGPSWSLIDFLGFFTLTAYMKTWNNALEIQRAPELMGSQLLYFRPSELTFWTAEGCFWWHHPVFAEESTTVSGILSQARSLAGFSVHGWGFWFLLLPQEPESKSREVLLCFPAVITGQHRSGVISARTRIDVLLDSFRKKQPFTHFLSFALNQPAIQEKFLQFKEEVLEKCSKVGIHMRIRMQSAVSFIERVLWLFLEGLILFYFLGMHF